MLVLTKYFFRAEIYFRFWTLINYFFLVKRNQGIDHVGQRHRTVAVLVTTVEKRKQAAPLGDAVDSSQVEQTVAGQVDGAWTGGLSPWGAKGCADRWWQSTIIDSLVSQSSGHYW